ncbi:AarF/UbiB family protein [Nocardia sp. CA-136227]|uniref:AarF/UbiB family protein n=1 Tax=Nocardia sp. CA-136227 TaxID=3239979 RepID=UPI003D987FC9
MVTETARHFPTAGNYQEALQNPSVCFTHAELRDSVPDLTKLRQPRAISGAFASVFPLTHTATGRRYAIKCFTRDVPDQQARYRAISEKLSALPAAELSQPWKIGFEYLPDAVLVGTARYPILKMEWAQGITLSAWLDAHHDDRRKVDRLTERFAQLILDLEAHGIAHGDLQHGNLLVADDETLRLLDYDGMFVPDLAGFAGTERGHRNYQSPRRGDDDFGTEMDRFSAWLIYSALKAVAIDPSLWRQLHETHGEYLLLNEDDLKHPEGSSRFPTLLSHSNLEIQQLAEHVRILAYQPLAALPALAPNPVAVVPAPTAPTTSASSGALPAWMTTGHLEHAATSVSPQQGTLDEPIGFAGRRVVDVLAMTFLVIAIAVGAFTVPLAPVLVVLASIGVWVARRTRVETIAHRSRLRDLDVRRGAVADTAGAADALQRDTLELDRSEQRRSSDQAGLRSQLKQRHDQELADIERRKITRATDLDRQILALEQRLREALRAALEQERNEIIQRELARFTLASASISGIGKTLTGELANNGIRTAADFTGIRVNPSTTGYSSTSTSIILASGRAVHVRGIGEAKGKSLLQWRDGLKTRAQARCNISAPTQGSAITSRFAADRQQLEGQRRSIDTDARTQRDQAKQRLEADQIRLSEDAAKAAAAAVRQRQEFARRRLEIQNAPQELAIIDARIAEVRRHRHVTSHRRYLKFVLVGR